MGNHFLQATENGYGAYDRDPSFGQVNGRDVFVRQGQNAETPASFLWFSKDHWVASKYGPNRSGQVMLVAMDVAPVPEAVEAPWQAPFSRSSRWWMPEIRLRCLSGNSGIAAWKVGLALAELEDVVAASYSPWPVGSKALL